MKIGFACGVFDLFHAGHVMALRECRAHCDYLLVGLNKADQFSEAVNPGKRRPFYSLEERKLLLENSRYVDEVVVYGSEEELMDIMKKRGISIRFLGEDYKGKPITGAELNIPIHYLDRSHGLSSTEVLNRINTRENG
jgi:glycerol-3-phosphate cytidylyltransferase